MAAVGVAGGRCHVDGVDRIVHDLVCHGRLCGEVRRVVVGHLAEHDHLRLERHRSGARQQPVQVAEPTGGDEDVPAAVTVADSRANGGRALAPFDVGDGVVHDRGAAGGGDHVLGADEFERADVARGRRLVGDTVAVGKVEVGPAVPPAAIADLEELVVDSGEIHVVERVVVDPVPAGRRRHQATDGLVEIDTRLFLHLDEQLERSA